MRKGITLYFGYALPPEERVKMIKDAGFDCIMGSADPRFDLQNGTIDEQMKMFEKYNLGISSLHSRYKTSELPDFWKDTPLGDKIEHDYIEDIMIAKKYGFSAVVLHNYGEYSKVGEQRLLRLLELCEKNGVYLAIENIDVQHPIFEIFENIHHKNLKFCYDIGHNNCFDPDVDYLEKYGDKLVCLHLHDNDGTFDMHTLNRFGNIDWDKFAKKLSKLNIDNISLDYEMLMNVKNDVTASECVTETFSQACELEKMIMKYKNLREE